MKCLYCRQEVEDQTAHTPACLVLRFAADPGYNLSKPTGKKPGHSNPQTREQRRAYYKVWRKKAAAKREEREATLTPAEREAGVAARRVKYREQKRKQRANGLHPRL